MERLQSIRDTIKYARRFHGSRFVVRLDDKVAVEALERGVYGEIDDIRQAGIEVIVAHSVPEICRIERTSGGFTFNTGKNKGHPVYGPGIMVYCKEGSVGDNDAADIALEQKAQKLIFVTRSRGVFHPPDRLLQQLSVAETRELLAKPGAVNGSMRAKLEASIRACSHGVERAHIIGNDEGNLLAEIFTCDGVGTMIYTESYLQIRLAENDELNDIMEILRATISKSCFDQVAVTKALGDFWVFSVDGDIHGCMQLIDHPDSKMFEVDCLAVTSRFENQDVYEQLLKHALGYSATKRHRGVFVNIKENTTHLPIYPWFMKLGFTRDVSGQVPRTDKNAGAGCWISMLK